ncbi:shikimate kinase [Corynebacterium suicordis]|uniref:Shikimate kinase n=1 Tax=Corynebacterium suicordis DSM 45110 TaxID=1121369 RepID=A0ABR9ZJD5_9CORY|nr:shikimate kinase [Corynebacterium suicordis]MBF4553547.1 shikimate kinase [Corynebacterium suicordis DSM 45110]MDR6277479.1 shikimate kinase [Corynebacterium suicordis]
MSPRVVLVGLPGSGKTTVGRRLANALHLTAVDTDQMIERKYGSACGHVFEKLGEERFREAEAEAVAEAMTTDGIVSLGGGAVLTASNRRLLANQRVVYLHVSAAEGVRRTSGDTSRPLLNVDNPAARYEQLLEERAQFYEEVANLLVHSDGLQPHRVVTQILQFLEEDEEDSQPLP